jgi:flagellar basal-body rod protein FlgB
VTEGLEAITAAALSLALDAASLRQQAYAANIANANSDGFVPLRVSFESQLEDARAVLSGRGRLEASSLEGVSPELQVAAPDGRGLLPKVQLDVEVAAMSQNAAQYQTLLKALSKHYALLAAAVSDGKK